MMKISIKKYQELYDINQMECSMEDKASLLVQCLTGKNEEQVKQMSKKKYALMCKSINDTFNNFSKSMNVQKPRKYVRIGWKIYKLNYKIAEPPMNTGRYVETATFVADIDKNIHMILSTMATPMQLTWKGLRPRHVDSTMHQSIADDMLKLDFAVGYQSCVFFCNLFKKSIKTSPTYFKTISVTPQMVQFYKETLISTSGGCTISNVCLN
jgi:hypothetical protein